MSILGICWLAIVCVTIFVAVVVLGVLYLEATVKLIESESTVKRIFGWVMAVLAILCVLVALYFVFSTQICM